MSHGSRVWVAETIQRNPEREQSMVEDLSSVFLTSCHPVIRRAVQRIAWLILYGPYRHPMASSPETRTGEQRTTVL